VALIRITDRSPPWNRSTVSIADLDGPWFVGATPAKVLGLTGGPFGGRHVIPWGFIAAVIGSEKNTGSTRSTISQETSRKFRLHSSGTNARLAPSSLPSWSGSVSERTDSMSSRE
jgi:hypothetical protein